MLKIVMRYHCGDEMEFLGENSQGYGFGCKVCNIIEYCNDPTAPIQGEPKPHKNPLAWGTETKIGNS